MDRAQLATALRQGDFSEYYRRADQVRAQTMGDIVHIRAILEFSNHCRRSCKYCGLRCGNTGLRRYRMQPEEIVSVCRRTAQAGYKTVVLQSGEDPWYTPELLADLVREIKATGMMVTLSCGELPYDALRLLREAGADRYLLKHETADPVIYRSLHPCGGLEARIQCLKNLKALGFETGSGFMIGLPGQTADTIAQDLLLLCTLCCDMAGIGPFLPHPATPLASQPPGSAELTRRAVALARILLPNAHLPATTSLGVLDPRERDQIFSGGANVIMKKVTPDPYRALYEIYPTPAAHTDIQRDRALLEEQIRSLGREPL